MPKRIALTVVLSVTELLFASHCHRSPPGQAPTMMVSTVDAAIAPMPASEQLADPPEAAIVRRRVSSRVAPIPAHLLGYNFGNMLTLLGYDISPATIRPGSHLAITWYWRCDAATGDDWRLLTHLDDANGPRQNHDTDGEVRHSLPPSLWQPGEYIRDHQEFDLPEDWDTPTLRIYVGPWRGEERMRVVRGRTDREGRALAIDTVVQLPRATAH